jgi:hypothetical protein
VIAEAASAFDEGEMTANADLGTTYKDLYL